jgi:hypothetical protein
MLTINQGPLPNDGETVDPSVFLEAWIAGTTVFGLPAGAFTGGTLQFVISATDAPATNERRVGLLWFARGEGRLYTWDQPDITGRVPFPPFPGDLSSVPVPGSSYSGVRGWISLSDRRDIWVRTVRHPCPVGAPLTFVANSVASNFNHHMLTGTDATDGQIRGPDRPERPIWACYPLTANSDGSCPPLAEIIFVARDSAGTNGILRAVEHGFCQVRCSSAMTGAGGWLRLAGGVANVGFIDGFSVLGTAASEISGMVTGFFSDSSATVATTQWLRGAYKVAVAPIGTTPNF